jgi:hypothetical protein
MFFVDFPAPAIDDRGLPDSQSQGEAGTTTENPIPLQTGSLAPQMRH